MTKERSKILLTQSEEAELLEYINSGGDMGDFNKYKNNESSIVECFPRVRDKTYDIMARLLYEKDSYTVKEEFKLNDIVKIKDNSYTFTVKNVIGDTLYDKNGNFYYMSSVEHVNDKERRVHRLSEIWSDIGFGDVIVNRQGVIKIAYAADYNSEIIYYISEEKSVTSTADDIANWRPYAKKIKGSQL